MQRETGRDQIWSIQYLRAIAAIWVVLYHQMQNLFASGAHGVDIFFVISGYIMVSMTRGSKASPSRFAKNRIARIVPLYWLATLGAFICIGVGIHFYDGSTNLGVLAKSLLFLPAYNENGRIMPTLYLGWTLNYELFFYSLFWLTLFFKPKVRISLLASAIIALVVAGLVYEWRSAPMRTYTDPIMLEFLAGAVLGSLHGANVPGRFVNSFVVGSLTIVTVTALASLYLGQILFASIAVALVAIALIAEDKNLMPKWRWLSSLGNASYSIYLFQQFGFALAHPLISLLIWITPSLDHTKGWRGLLGTGMAIGLGLFLKVALEDPLNSWAKKNIKRRATVAAL